jgi:hypothetical protein
MTAQDRDDERGRLLPAVTWAATVPAAIGAGAVALLSAVEPNRAPSFPIEAVAPMLVVIFCVGFLVAAAHAVMLGLPIYRLLRSRGPVGWTAAALAGFVIGAIPVQLLEDAGQDRVAAALIFGCLGVSGALAFRFALRRTQ